MKRVFVIVGPSAVGKTYLAEQLTSLYPSLFEQVSIFTTRAPRNNEVLTDRICISAEAFTRKQDDGDFMIAEFFHGNYYGYSKQSLKPATKHLIVNAWPALIPRLASIDNVCFVGLRVAEVRYAMLGRRMLKRGDNPEVITQRLKAIKQDSMDLRRLGATVRSQGKMFEITGNNTIHDSIIPWVISVSNNN